MHFSEARWRAAGVRHEILLRMWPLQQHDILGPLSVMRLSLAILQRRVAVPVPDGVALGLKVGELGVQMDELLAALASLRCWDGSPGDSAEVVRALPLCLALAGHVLGLRGHRLEAPAVASGSDPVRVPDFTYAVLGLLLHAVDRHTTAQIFHLAHQPGQLRLWTEPLPPRGVPAPLPVPPRPRLDARALQWLVDDLGWTVTQVQAPVDGRSEWRLCWRPRALTPSPEAGCPRG